MIVIYPKILMAISFVDSKLSDLLGRKGRICLLRFALAAAEHYTDLHVSVRSVEEIPSYRQICAERKKIRNIW